MNWPLFWALLFGFGIIIGNIMLIKHSAKIKMPSLKDAKATDPAAAQREKEISHRRADAEKTNTPE